LKEHAGHDEMHAEMVLILLVTMTLSQIILLVWRKNSPRTFHNVTLLGLWLIPMGFSIFFVYWRFMIVWVIFSLINSFVIYNASRKPLSQGTPRFEKKKKEKNKK